MTPVGARRDELGGRRATAARLVLSLGPATILAGVVWALIQPYRVTLLTPQGESFWWLAVEPPLLVIAVGLLFHFLIRPGLLEDVEGHAAAR